MDAPSSWSPLLILKLFLQYHAQILQFLKTYFQVFQRSVKKIAFSYPRQIFTSSN